MKHLHLFTKLHAITVWYTGCSENLIYWTSPLYFIAEWTCMLAVFCYHHSKEQIYMTFTYLYDIWTWSSTYNIVREFTCDWWLLSWLMTVILTPCVSSSYQYVTHKSIQPYHPITATSLWMWLLDRQTFKVLKMVMSKMQVYWNVVLYRWVTIFRNFEGS